MIKLTKLDGTSIVVNNSFIESINQAPDTIVCMQSGRTFAVKENAEQIVELCIDYNLSCRQGVKAKVTSRTNKK